MDDLAVIGEHIHLLNRWDVGHSNALQSRCELLVICRDNTI